jgi:hypothetical protein
VTCDNCGAQLDYHRRQQDHDHAAQGNFVVAAKTDMLNNQGHGHAGAIDQISNDRPKQKQGSGQSKYNSIEI